MHFINKYHCILEFKQHLSILINLFFKLFLPIGCFGGISFHFGTFHGVAKLKHIVLLNQNVLKHQRSTFKCSQMLQNILQNAEKLSKMLQKMEKHL